MRVRSIAVMLLLACQIGCVSLNPYVRMKTTMRHPDSPDGPNYCWARTDECGAGGNVVCRDALAARNLDECVESWRPRATWRTTELDAWTNLEECMRNKGWELVWISGVMHME